LQFAQSFPIFPAVPIQFQNFQYRSKIFTSYIPSEKRVKCRQNLSSSSIVDRFPQKSFFESVYLSEELVLEFLQFSQQERPASSSAASHSECPDVDDMLTARLSMKEKLAPDPFDVFEYEVDGDQHVHAAGNYLIREKNSTSIMIPPSSRGHCYSRDHIATIANCADGISLLSIG
jgi:hypothetical protein